MNDEKQDFWNPNRTKDYKALEKFKEREAERKKNGQLVCEIVDKRTMKYKYV